MGFLFRDLKRDDNNRAFPVIVTVGNLIADLNKRIRVTHSLVTVNKREGLKQISVPILKPLLSNSSELFAGIFDTKRLPDK